MLKKRSSTEGVQKRRARYGASRGTNGSLLNNPDLVFFTCAHRRQLRSGTGPHPGGHSLGGRRALVQGETPAGESPGHTNEF